LLRDLHTNLAVVAVIFFTGASGGMVYADAPQIVPKTTKRETTSRISPRVIIGPVLE
jgi:hypothetical protein